MDGAWWSTPPLIAAIVGHRRRAPSIARGLRGRTHATGFPSNGMERNGMERNALAVDAEADTRSNARQYRMSAHARNGFSDNGLWNGMEWNGMYDRLIAAHARDGLSEPAPHDAHADRDTDEPGAAVAALGERPLRALLVVKPEPPDPDATDVIAPNLGERPLRARWSDRHAFVVKPPDPDA